KKYYRKEKRDKENFHLKKGLKNFVRIPQPSPIDKGSIIKKKRSRISIEDGHFITSHSGDLLSAIDENIYSSQVEKLRSCHHNPSGFLQSTTEKIPELIYLRQLPECKKLKIWLSTKGFISIFH